jgi:hypothetical protein
MIAICSAFNGGFGINLLHDAPQRGGRLLPGESLRDRLARRGAELPRHVAPVDGESLYAAADAIDIAVLAALGSR